MQGERVVHEYWMNDAKPVRAYFLDFPDLPFMLCGLEAMTSKGNKEKT
jgi:hypothetical protein